MGYKSAELNNAEANERNAGDERASGAEQGFAV